MSVITRMLRKTSGNWHSNGSLGACVCSQLRRTTRKVTAIYDKAMASGGLTVSQYSLLVNVARSERISLGALADRVGMDRTSLTRSLKPLEVAGLVVPVDSEDRRQRLLGVSPEGLRRVKLCFALWKTAQAEFNGQIGNGTLALLRESLAAAEAACEA